ncbi:pathogenesis-related gene 5 [Striga asiatica]|uniref:Pathogenesis-related gene 5 n=1 Tax=Striga asiatica TaxID=4170 RepID=A0A5A7PX32_STRAF|nr:pathogenesis-related gene 5 [Striga asiatica]
MTNSKNPPILTIVNSMSAGVPVTPPPPPPALLKPHRRPRGQQHQTTTAATKNTTIGPLLPSPSPSSPTGGHELTPSAANGMAASATGGGPTQTMVGFRRSILASVSGDGLQMRCGGLQQRGGGAPPLRRRLVGSMHLYPPPASESARAPNN